VSYLTSSASVPMSPGISIPLALKRALAGMLKLYASPSVALVPKEYSSRLAALSGAVP
jgi:hypothetical protein